MPRLKIKDLIGDQLVDGQTYYNIKDDKLTPIENPRITDDPGLVCLFSCGSTSYVATKMALQENRKRWNLTEYVIYTVVVNEPADNLRFLQDAQEKLGVKIILIINDEYRGDIYKVQAKGYIVGIKGAPCTTQLKWKMRVSFVKEGDIQVFGFHKGEEQRMDDFARANETVEVSCPLICSRITKQKAKQEILNDGLKLPESYIHYQNANCIGCVKGGVGYWQQVRIHDPDVFNHQALIERELNVSICKKYKVMNEKNVNYINDWLVKDGKEPLDLEENYGKNIRLRLFLDQIDKEKGVYKVEPLPDCGVLCELEQGNLNLRFK